MPPESADSSTPGELREAIAPAEPKGSDFGGRDWSETLPYPGLLILRMWTARERRGAEGPEDASTPVRHTPNVPCRCCPCCLSSLTFPGWHPSAREGDRWCRRCDWTFAAEIFDWGDPLADMGDVLTCRPTGRPRSG